MEYARIQLEVIHVNAKLDSKGTEEVVEISMNVLMEHTNAKGVELMITVHLVTNG